MSRVEHGASNSEKPLFKNKIQEKLFWEKFSIRSPNNEKVNEALVKWESSLNQTMESIPIPEGFDLFFIGVRNWDELKTLSSCLKCGAPTDFVSPNCHSCSVGKPHIILASKENDSESLVNIENWKENTLHILPDGYELEEVGANSIDEIISKGSCSYCGSPITFFLPNCSYCEKSKPYIKLKSVDESFGQQVEWFNSISKKATISQEEVPGYMSNKEIIVSENCKGGVCKSEKIFLEEGSSVISLKAIEATLKKGSIAKEIEAVHVRLERQANVETVIIYDGGTLFIDESARIKNLIIGKGVKIVINTSGVSRFISIVYKMSSGSFHDGSIEMGDYLIPKSLQLAIDK